MWLSLSWRSGIWDSSPDSRRLAISRRNTPDLEAGSRKRAFLSDQSAAGSRSSILFARLGGVKTSSLLRFARQFKTSGLCCSSVSIGNPIEGAQRELAHRLGDEGWLAGVRYQRLGLRTEKRLLDFAEKRSLKRPKSLSALPLAFPREIAEHEVPPLDLHPVHRRPLGNNDRRRLRPHRRQRQRVAPN